jgi:hypothetical protein
LFLGRVRGIGGASVKPTSAGLLKRRHDPTPALKRGAPLWHRSPDFVPMEAGAEPVGIVAVEITDVAVSVERRAS